MINDLVEKLKVFSDVTVGNPLPHDNELPDVMECLSNSYSYVLSDPWIRQIFADTNGISIATLDRNIEISHFGEVQVPGISMYEFPPLQNFKFAESCRKPRNRFDCIEYAVYAYPNNFNRIKEIVVIGFQQNKRTGVVLWRGTSFSEWLNRLIETSGSFTNQPK